MKQMLLAAAAVLALAAPSQAEETPQAGTASPPPAAPAPMAPLDLPGFAARLAQLPPPTGPSAWQGTASWNALLVAAPERRQEARWDHARALLGRGRAAEALGVLAVMRGADADLDRVAAFRLAEGVALTQLRRWSDAAVALAAPGLATNPEACAWRLRAFAGAGEAETALAELPCALPAINSRQGDARTPFVIAAAEQVIDAGRPQNALPWLQPLPDRDPAVNLLRGRALIATGALQDGRLRLERALVSGTAEQRADARLAMIEADLKQGNIAGAAALEKLDALRFGWRGGPVERRALRLSMRLAEELNDPRAALRAGAALFRYFNPGSEAGELLAQLQSVLASLLAADSALPVAEAAGLYWDYRELAPAGAEGDAMVRRLAERLQSESLYGRAAELLQYQLSERTQDVAQGPLSVQVATLHVLAGDPDRALRTLRDTEQPGYSPAMLHDRKRIEAVALQRLGRYEAAMAALESVPANGAIRAEFLWRRKEWGSFVAANAAALPGGGRLEPEAQTAVLRHAVALAMLGQEPALAALRGRYADRFAALPTASVFDALTQPSGSVDPEVLGRALAAIPAASPAGGLADLLDASEEAAAPQG
ncbi:hypothetical protein [Sphingosinithalassobacter sp. LHW66-3]|uniref:hypothetical protein n=1 Tax=Sphingosinithalassobacter sp. LHW66-3 TaxID=3424718 RepID=UPI003D6AA738